MNNDGDQTDCVWQIRKDGKKFCIRSGLKAANSEVTKRLKPSEKLPRRIPLHKNTTYRNIHEIKCVFFLRVIYNNIQKKASTKIMHNT